MEHGDNPERACGEMAGGGPPSSTASDAARVASTTSIPPPHSQAAPSSPEPSSRAVVKWIALSQLLNTAGYMAGSVPRRELLTAAGVGDERSLSYLSAAGSIAAALEFLVCPAIGKLMDAHGRWGVTAAIATLCLAPRLLISTLLATGGRGSEGRRRAAAAPGGAKVVGAATARLATTNRVPVMLLLIDRVVGQASNGLLQTCTVAAASDIATTRQELVSIQSKIAWHSALGLVLGPLVGTSASTLLSVTKPLQHSLVVTQLLKGDRHYYSPHSIKKKHHDPHQKV